MRSKPRKKWGWDRLRNGDLIQMAEGVFDVLITSDQSLKYQQNLLTRKLGIIALPTNHLPSVLQLAPKIALALSELFPGSVIEIQLFDLS
jgi:hypothetical protein